MTYLNWSSTCSVRRSVLVWALLFCSSCGFNVDVIRPVYWTVSKEQAARESAIREKAVADARAKEMSKEAVFFVHGMGRTRVSMSALAQRFRDAGYRAHEFEYDRSVQSLDEITENFSALIKEHAGAADYHILGHSLGNIIIRNGFKKGYTPGLGKIVMIAPPNRPALPGGAFADTLFYRWIGGDSGPKPAGKEFYESLAVPDVPFGILAGARGSPLLSPAANDGVILVETTKLEGAADFAVLYHGHTFFMNAQDTFDYSRIFIQTGAFPH